MNNRSIEIGNAVAENMRQIVDSDSHIKMFAAPAVKLASDKCCNCDKCDSGCPCQKKCNESCEVCKTEKPDNGVVTASKLSSIVENLTKLSTVLDELGLSKSSIRTLTALDSVISEIALNKFAQISEKEYGYMKDVEDEVLKERAGREKYNPLENDFAEPFIDEGLPEIDNDFDEQLKLKRKNEDLGDEEPSAYDDYVEGLDAGREEYDGPEDEELDEILDPEIPGLDSAFFADDSDMAKEDVGEITDSMLKELSSLSLKHPDLAGLADDYLNESLSERELEQGERFDTIPVRDTIIPERDKTLHEFNPKMRYDTEFELSSPTPDEDLEENLEEVIAKLDFWIEKHAEEKIDEDEDDDEDKEGDFEDEE